MHMPTSVHHRWPPCSFDGLSEEAVRAFCAATGDDNPIHLDRTAARAAGLDDLVVPGMLLAALFARAVTGPAQQLCVRDLQVQFVHPLCVGQAFTIERHIIQVNAAGIETARLKARSEQAMFALGEARLMRAGASSDETGQRTGYR